jgi:hypothetical protein
MQLTTMTGEKSSKPSYQKAPSTGKGKKALSQVKKG